MKILWIKAGGLVPLDLGGRIRSYHILTELARKHEVTLFTFYSAPANDPHAQLEGLLHRVICVPLHLPAQRSIGEVAWYVRNALTLRPYQVAKYCRPPVLQQLKALLRSENFDVMVCDFAIAGGAIPWKAHCTKVLFTHNIEAVIWKRHCEIASGPLWKLVSWREYRTMSRAERLYARRADHVLTVSESDREFFSRLVGPKKVSVVPTGVDVDYFRPSTGEEQTGLVFTGAMDWVPNEDGVLYFVREILPRIRRDVPEVTLSVVGREPSARLKALAEGEGGVRVTGRVEDIRPYVHRASVYVVPLRIGGGTRLKIFEAMAMGKAVVSTSIGAEGLPVTHEKNIILADDPNTFADEVVRLLRDSVVRAALGKAARALVEQRYSWRAVAREFEAVLNRLERKPVIGAKDVPSPIKGVQ